MAKRNYYIDIEHLTLSTEAKDKTRSRKILLGGTGISVILGVVFAVLFFRFFSSPSEKRLQRQIDDYKIKYYILNTRINALMKGINDIEEKDDYTYRLIYELHAVPEDMRKAGIGGAVHYQEFFASENTTIAGISMQKIDLAMRKMQIQERSFSELEEAARDKEKMLASIPTIMPVVREKVRITSMFGWRKNPFNRRITSFHSGVDFAGKIGTPVYATGNGVVTHETGRMQGYGIVVVINHGYGYQTLYAHLNKAKVKPGQQVKRGQLIGTIGRTGSTTGPHLHYEVIKNGQKVNPMNFITGTLTKEEYNQILEEAKKLE